MSSIRTRQPLAQCSVRRPAATRVSCLKASDSGCERCVRLVLRICCTARLQFVRSIGFFISYIIVNFPLATRIYYHLTHDAWSELSDAIKLHILQVLLLHLSLSHLNESSNPADARNQCRILLLQHPLAGTSISGHVRSHWSKSSNLSRAGHFCHLLPGSRECLLCKNAVLLQMLAIQNDMNERRDFIESAHSIGFIGHLSRMDVGMFALIISANITIVLLVARALPTYRFASLFNIIYSISVGTHMPTPMDASCAHRRRRRATVVSPTVFPMVTVQKQQTNTSLMANRN